MDHSLHPRLREYLFEVANALLTVPVTVGNFAGNRISLQLEESKGAARLTGRLLTIMRLIHERTGEHHE